MANTPSSLNVRAFNKASDTVSAIDAVEITPNDAVDIQPTRSLLIGVAGNLKVTMVGGTTATLPVTVGYNPLQVKRVWAAEQTAVGIFGLY